MYKFPFPMLFVIAFGLAAQGHAAQPIIYPAKGQTVEQQSRDEGECHVWAKTNTGIDPVELAAQPVAPEQSSGGGAELARGAVGGALGGAAVGAIAGDTGEGAAIGAVVGTLAGGHRARQNAKAQRESAVQSRAEQVDTFNRAYSACLEGRGYTVK